MKLEKISASEFKLLEDISVSSLGHNITVKAGFVFDGASIPRAFWSIAGTPFTGRYTRAALVHDALYVSQVLPRAESDLVFLDIMEQDGTELWHRKLMYHTVKWFGFTKWNRRKIKEPQWITIRKEQE